MKQHITPKQLNELNGEGVMALRKWWKPKEGDWVTWDGKDFCLGYIGYQKEYKFYFDLMDKRRTVDLVIIPEIKISILDEGLKVTDEFQTIKKLRLRGDLIHNAFPLLSIGQMVEFLEGKSTKEHYTALDVVIFEQGVTGTVLLPEEKWCDALWEAVKELLNNTQKEIQGRLGK